MSDVHNHAGGGNRFVNALSRIGYYKTGLRGSDFDWMFETEGLPFLDWFCDTVSEENLLTAQELNVFEQLKLSGKVITGESLNSSLHYLPDFSSEKDQEYLKNDIHLLEKQLQNINSHMKELSHQKDMLGNLIHKLNNDVEIAENMAIQEELQWCDEIEATELWGKQMQQGISEVATTIGRISAHMEGSHQGKQSADVLPLSQMDLQAYKLAEDSYTTELSNYMVKQFERPLSGRDNFRAMSSNPNQHAQSPDIIDQYNKEITRLHGTLQRAENHMAVAKIEAAGARSCITWLEECCLSNWLNELPSDLQLVRALQQHVKMNVSTVTQDFDQTLNRKLPDAVRVSAEHRWSAIVSRYADLKMARQEYSRSKQERIIGLLLEQQARKKFVNFALELEDQNQYDIQKMLQEILSSIGKEWTAFTECKKKLSNMKHGREDQTDKQVIESKVDMTASNVYNVLAGLQPQKDHLYLTYEHLNRLGKEYQEELDSLTSQQDTCSATLLWLSTLVPKWKKAYPHYWQASLHALSTASKDAAVSWNIANSQLSLIKKHVFNVTLEHEQKRRKLQQIPLRVQERALVPLFYSDPDKFKEAIKSTIALAETDQPLHGK